jgi:hypothetical protein
MNFSGEIEKKTRKSDSTRAVSQPKFEIHPPVYKCRHDCYIKQHDTKTLHLTELNIMPSRITDDMLK